MARGKSKTKERFVQLPYYLLSHPAYMGLTGRALRLLIDLIMQYNGANNGDLDACYKRLKDRGWTHRTLQRAKGELLTSGLVEKTRQGGLNSGPTLYALTWKPINEKRGRWPLDVKPTKTPSFLYRRTEGAGSG